MRSRSRLDTWLGYVVLFSLAAYPQGLRAAELALENADAGIRVVFMADGVYRVHFRGPHWDFEGRLPLSPELREKSDADALGAYDEILAERSGFPTFGIRLYRHHPVLLFTEISRKGPVHSVRFPRFSTYPKELKTLSYLHREFSPTVFDLSGDAPWLFFDSAGTSALLSPANHFMVANCFRRGSELSVGIEDQVEGSGPLTFQSILVLTPGINHAYEIWGNALTKLAGKTRPGNEADPVLSSLGYWTDNRSSYWYNYVNQLGYEGTLRAVLDEFRRKGLPVGHLQLDSWWYVKGGEPKASPPLEPGWGHACYRHGIYLYEAAKELFPGGLALFQNEVGLPLVTHSRWIDPSSPYTSRFTLSRQVSTDPGFWDEVMRYLQRNGVVTYEQDWLNEKALPRLDRWEDGERFLDEMAAAARRYGINLQYCMPLPRHFLQGSRYSNLHSIRTSGDGFERGKWRQFILGSRLATALGIWPWADVMFSDDKASLLIANLSGGIVGVGDRLSGTSSGDFNPSWCKKDLVCRTVSVENLKRVMRRDGLLVKADSPLVPTDRTFLAQAESPHSQPFVARASTLNDSRVVADYLFAFAPDDQDLPVWISAQDYGIPGAAYLYHYFEGKGERLEPGQKAREIASPRGSYFILLPIQENGMALIGDPGLFVTLGKQRLELVRQDETAMDLNLYFGRDERKLGLTVYAPDREPLAQGRGCRVESSHYDPPSGLFRVLWERGLDTLSANGTCQITLKASGF